MLPPLHLPTAHSLSYPPLFSNSTSMDPSAVDFRAFYPYTPNEVKHRKRTTSAQLKILETVFKRDTKPNAALRNELAVQLDMTARGVQVWFQNRRAKEKNKAGKAAAAASGSAQEIKTSTGDEPRGTESVLLPQLAFPQDLPELGDSSSQESSPTGGSPPPQLHVNTDSSIPSWQSSPLATPDDARLPSDFTDACMIRRGSLPVDAFFTEDCSHGPPLVGHLDPFARRRSVDASLHRLAANPYANIARAKNGVLSGSRISGYMREPFSLSRASPVSVTANDPSSNVVHLSNHQHHHHHHPHGIIHARHSSVDSRAFRFSPIGVPVSPSPSPLSAYHAVRTSLPDNQLYAFSSRPVAEPIPGPLPSPDFSFGIANIASPRSVDSERNSPDNSQGFLFRGEDLDTEDDSTSVSYGGFSRFGSIASIGTSDSSTSAYYSDVGSCVDSANAADLAPDHHHRRDASGHFAGLMSSLNVGSMSGQQQPTDESSATGNQYDSVTVAPMPVTAALNLALKENERTSTYPSPSSTVSPSESPLANEVNPAASANVPISLSSELVYALQTKQDQDGLAVGYQQHTNSPPKEAEVPFFLSLDLGQNQSSSNLPLEYGGAEYSFVNSTDHLPSTVSSKETGYGANQPDNGVNDRFGVNMNAIAPGQVDYAAHPHDVSREQSYSSFEGVDPSSTSGFL